MTGWKTWLGVVGWAVLNGLAQAFPEYADLLIWFGNYVFGPLAVIGVAHKIEKIA